MTTTSIVPKSMTSEFLRTIIPQGYKICLSSVRTHPNMGRAKQPWRNHFFGPKANGQIDKTLALAEKYDDTNWYFGLAGYGPADDRTAENAAAMQVLVIDADIKPGGFTSKADVFPALLALKIAVPALPSPWIVDSGHGLHIYYRLATPLPIIEWHPLASLFVAVARGVDPRLMADSQCTRDAARVLRIPNTYNAKDHNRIKVTLLKEGGVAKATAVREGLASAAGAMGVTLGVDLLPNELFAGSRHRPAHLKPPEDDSFGAGLTGNIGEKLVDLPLRPILEGCKQMRDMVVSGGNVPYDQWMLMLRVINTTKNPEKAACLASQGHPEYSQGNTLFKLREIQTKFGAVTAGCKEFADCNPKGCHGCPHKKDIWTPSQLALRPIEEQEIAHATEEALQAAALGVTDPKGYLPQASSVKQVLTAAGTEVTTLPVRRGKSNRAHEPVFNAHLHLRGCSDRLDTTMVDRQEVRKPSDRHVHIDVTWNQHTTNLSIPSVALTGDGFGAATEPFRDLGVTFERDLPAKTAILDYLGDLNRLSAAKVTYYRPLKGWHKSGVMGEWEFVAGARTFYPDGTVEENFTVAEHRGLPPENMGFMERVCTGYPRGRINLWQQGMSIYTGPRRSVAQLLLLSGLANMLFPLISEDKGGIVLTLTGEAGKGKTTLLKFLASFTGSHTQYIIPGTSTENALGSLMKEANCLMLPVDDTIQQNAQTFSNLLTLVSGGAEKARMLWDSKSGGSTFFEEGFNASLLMTSNYSSTAMLGAGDRKQRQMQVEAARSRTLEIPAHLVDLSDTTSSDWTKAINLISKHYGHAAPAFLSYVVKHQTPIHLALLRAEDHLRRKIAANVHPDKAAQARFWARWLAASAITARIVCDRLNLLPWNAETIIQAGLQLAHNATESARHKDEELIDAFWDSFRERNLDNPEINRCARVATHPVPWNWRTCQRAQRVQNSGWKDGSPVQVINDRTQYRAMLETIDILDNGQPLQRERTIYATISSLKHWVEMHRGEALPVTDWSDLATRLIGIGCVVMGVYPHEPDKMDRDHCPQVDLGERPTGKTGHKARVVEIRLPPVRLFR